MDPTSVPHSLSPIDVKDEWDNEGFIIPRLGIENSDLSKSEARNLEDSVAPPNKDKSEKLIYLGPHGAPPQSKQHDPNPSNRKQQFKQKLKEANRRTSGTGQENKVESLKELVGSRGRGNIRKGSSKEWLDPHCDESLFDRKLPH